MSDKKTNFILHDDYVDFLDGLSDEEFGKLIRVISTYNRTGELPNLPISLSIAFNFIRKRMDDERTKWEETRNARAEAGKKGAEKRWNINGQTANDGKNSNAINANGKNGKPIFCHNSKIANDGKNAVSVSVSVSESVSVNNKKKICSSGDERDALPEQNQAEAEKKKEQAEKRKREVEENERRFNTFWEAYPKKTSKKTAMQSWNKLKVTDKLLEEILAGLARYRASPQWQKDNGQFIPHPSTFLNQERWKDETEPITGAPPGINPPEKTQNRKGRHKLNPNKNYDFVDAELLAIIESMEAE